MYAKHADEPSALTDLWVGASKTAMALRAFVLAPANIRLPTGGKIAFGSGPYLGVSRITRRASQADAVGAVWPGAHAKRHICFPNSPPAHTGQRARSICVFCVHRLPLSALKFLLA